MPLIVRATGEICTSTRRLQKAFEDLPAKDANDLSLISHQLLSKCASPTLLHIHHLTAVESKLLRLAMGMKRVMVPQPDRLHYTIVIVHDWDKGNAFQKVKALMDVALRETGEVAINGISATWGKAMLFRGLSANTRTQQPMQYSRTIRSAIERIARATCSQGVIWHEAASPKLLEAMLASSALSGETESTVKIITISEAISTNSDGRWNLNWRDSSNDLRGLLSLTALNNIPTIFVYGEGLGLHELYAHDLKDFDKAWPGLLPPEIHTATVYSHLDKIAMNVFRVRGAVDGTSGTALVKRVESLPESSRRNWADESLKEMNYSRDKCCRAYAKTALAHLVRFCETPIDGAIELIADAVLDPGWSKQHMTAIGVQLEFPNSTPVARVSVSPTTFVLLANDKNAMRTHVKNQWTGFANSAVPQLNGTTISPALANSWRTLSNQMSFELRFIKRKYGPSYEFKSKQQHDFDAALVALEKGPMTQLCKRSLEAGRGAARSGRPRNVSNP